jgi:hypothetical protein
MPMGQGRFDGEGLLWRNQELISQKPSKGLDFEARPMGKIGEGLLTDLAALAEGLPEKRGGRGVAIGNGFHVHGYYYIHASQITIFKK